MYLVDASHGSSFLFPSTNYQWPVLWTTSSWKNPSFPYFILFYSYFYYFLIILFHTTSSVYSPGYVRGPWICSHVGNALLSPQHLAHSLGCQQPLHSAALKPEGRSRVRVPQAFFLKPCSSAAPFPCRSLGKNRSLQPLIERQNNSLGQCVGEVGCPRSSRAGNFLLSFFSFSERETNF